MPLGRRVDIHIVGEADLGFLSQIAFFCRSLRRIYRSSEPIRVRCFLGGPAFDWSAAPPHVQACRDDIEIICADPADYAARSYYSQCDESYLNVRDDAEVIVFADADTFWLRRSDELFEAVYQNRAVAGCMAHFPPPGGGNDPQSYWSRLFADYVGRPPKFDHVCSLLPGSESPFYVNFAFVVIDAATLRQHGEAFVEQVRALVASSSNPYFSYQIGLTLWAAKLGLKTMPISLRYNFPNDDRVFQFADLDEREIVVVHYLREAAFRRSELFRGAEAFSAFMSKPKGRGDTLLSRLLTEECDVAQWLALPLAAKGEEKGDGRGCA